MAPSHTLLAALLLGLVAAQTPGKAREVHPKLSTWKCDQMGCRELRTSVVLDSATHPIYQAKDHNLSCTNGSSVDSTVCPDQATCAKNCVIDGVSDYAEYGVTTSGGSLTLNLNANGSVASPRVYLLAEGEREYELLKLTGQELSFEVDASKLPCGMNGAFYLSEMEADGGRSKLNPAGASYGTGYCDAQCYSTAWVNGVANIKEQGVCCNELDIWEANSRSTQLAPHTCSKPGLYLCDGDECGATGVCDKNGCANNPYGVGAHDYYGPSRSNTVDTSRPFTVITQFPAKDGVLQSIVRKYMQDGKLMDTAEYNVTGPIDDDYCTKNKATAYMANGGTKEMGQSMSRGMVLAMSIWWDQSGFMNWLDSGNAGPCNATEGNPAVVTTIVKNPVVTFSQIKWGDIGTTTTTSRRPSWGNGWVPWAWTA